MDVNRREVIGIITAGAASAGVAEGQAPINAPPQTADAGAQAARQGLQGAMQQIAMVKLPPTTEPAFLFRA